MSVIRLYSMISGAIMGAALLFLGTEATITDYRTKDWSETKASLIHSSFEKQNREGSDENCFYIDISYRYQVNGKIYVNQKFERDSKSCYDTALEAKWKLRKYLVNDSTIIVRYNPDDPSKIYAQIPPDNWGGPLGILMGAGLLFVSFYGILWFRKKET